MSRYLIVLTALLCLTFFAYPAFGDDALVGTISAARHGFTVIPPGPVSDKISVEMRLTVRNDTQRDVTYQVKFFIDEFQKENLIHNEQVSLKAGEQRLVSHWWPTAGHAGKRSILYRVEYYGNTIDQGKWPIEILPSKTSALPWAQGMWLDPGGLQCYVNKRVAIEEDVRAAIDAMRDIGLSMVLVSYVEDVCFGGGPYYPSKVEAIGKQQFHYDVIDVIMDQAARNGQHVVLGIGRGPEDMLVVDGYKDPIRLNRALDAAKQVGQELWERYSRYPSFYGWYLCHEAGDMPGMGAFFDPISDFLHSFSPDKPTFVGPTGTPLMIPATLMNAHYDAVIYQDAVGPGYVPYAYTWDPEKRLAMLDDVCASYRAAHYNTKKHRWANVETWQMDGPKYTNGYAADFSRVLRQIEIEKKYFEMITMYEFLGTMDPPGTQIALGGEASERLYSEYQKYYKRHIGAARKEAARTNRKQR